MQRLVHIRALVLAFFMQPPTRLQLVMPPSWFPRTDNSDSLSTSRSHTSPIGSPGSTRYNGTVTPATDYVLARVRSRGCVRRRSTTRMASLGNEAFNRPMGHPKRTRATTTGNTAWSPGKTPLSCPSPCTHRRCQRHPELSRYGNKPSLAQRRGRGRLSAVSHPRIRLAMAAQDEARADEAERWVTLSLVFYPSRRCCVLW